MDASVVPPLLFRFYFTVGGDLMSQYHLMLVRRAWQVLC